jgi:hypothetical protein
MISWIQRDTYNAVAALTRVSVQIELDRLKDADDPGDR